MMIRLGELWPQDSAAKAANPDTFPQSARQSEVGGSGELERTLLCKGIQN